MAMRLFGGLLPAQQATIQVERLFGSLNGSRPTVGYLACHFQESSPTRLGKPIDPLDSNYGHGRWQFDPPDVMEVEGSLTWELVRPCAYKQELSALIAALHGLVMNLGGFSKGWRRVDHRLFPLYHNQSYYSKTPIGCHWDWIQVNSDTAWIQVRSKSGLEELIEHARHSALEWLRAQGSKITSLPGECPSRWREVIHPKKMLIWARQAESHEDCAAIDWFHLERIKSGNPAIRDVRFKQSEITGRTSRIGHIWHRMLPLHADDVGDYEPISEAHARSDKIIPEVWTGKYLEIVTFFPGLRDRALEQDFLTLMNRAQGGQGANFRPIRFS